jgi:hypothetical protein
VNDRAASSDDACAAQWRPAVRVQCVAAAAGLFLVAVGYFWLGIHTGIELTDAGMLLYPSWRVARGRATPELDFMQVFGPANFVLNGLLLRWFGDDLSVIRASLVVVKAAVAVLTYTATRIAAGRLAGVLAYALLVAVWGVPNWVFNTPYPNHYALALTLTAPLVVIALRRRFLAAWLLAGACCGAAATFKQTSGVFALLGLGLYLVWDPSTGAVPPFPGGRGAARALRSLFLVGALAACVAYLWPQNAAWNVALLFGPAALSLALLAGREWRALVEAPERGAWGLLAAGAGFTLPLFAWAAYFGVSGGASAFYLESLARLPRLIHWFEPLAPPPPRALLIIGLMAGIVVAVRVARQVAAVGAKRIAAAAAVLSLVALTVVVPRTFAAPDFYWELIWPTALLPFLVTWAALPFLFPEIAAWSPGRRHAAPAAPVFSLFACLAATLLLLFYPSSDFAHLLMALPLFLPLAAMLAVRWYRVANRAGRAAAAATVVGMVALLAAPFGGFLISSLREPVSERSFARAPGVSGSGERFEQAAELVQYLDVQAPALPLFVLGNESLLYLLSGRDSILPREEFLFYMIGFGAITRDDARATLSADAIVNQIRSRSPIVVDYTDHRGVRFRRTYPEVVFYLDTHYRVAKEIGPYRVLGWAR